MAILYEDRTHAIRHCFFDVQNNVGVGRDEEDYHQALVVCFRNNDVPFVSKPIHPLFLYGEQVYRLIPDFVVWGKITIELKAVPRHPSPAEFVQLFDYLKCRRDSLGLLVNMGLDRVIVERVAYTPTPPRLVEDWKYWKGSVSGATRDIGRSVRNVLRDVYREHGTGYGEEVFEKLLLFGLRHQGMKVTVNPTAEARYTDTQLRKSSLRCFLIEDEVVLCQTALFEDNSFNMNRCRSYMKALGSRWGIAANFGKSLVEIVGLRRQ
ncbi:hypothetical protein Mal15_43690 [Stieleria maiorica]|uniref:GxxExxY protein n=1 Tax=Stieleria maiorica TaxID=2795974 RepID=A0A5B9MGJ9_9BACT|nr:GxxExxY protein [Stieleria maiorica]QEG00299.1 hypothetical protein Mal15_43690 [Stieleria maiorica]